MPSPGQRVGEYLLIDRIGGGAFGEVWRARHHAWEQRVVAVKFPGGPFVRQLELEGVALRRLDHLNVVKPLGFDPYADPPYLVLEYVAGGNLRDLIRRGPLPAAEAAAILQQVLAALGHAHAQGLIHRDVKPENVLREAGPDGEAAFVKVTDFGLGKEVGPADRGHHSIILSQEHGEERSIVGSTGYMAPEQLDGGEVDARADVYACGVLLFEMLTGRRPEGVELPSDLNPAIPAAFDEVFRRSFARRERRFASAQEFSRALAAATSGNDVARAAPAREPAGQGPAPRPACRRPASGGLRGGNPRRAFGGGARPLLLCPHHGAAGD